jgi:hypothetical protein
VPPSLDLSKALRVHPFEAAGHLLQRLSSLLTNLTHRRAKRNGRLVSSRAAGQLNGRFVSACLLYHI